MASKLRKYHITQEKIAKILGYSSLKSFQNSSARARILSGLNELIELVEEELIKELKR
jgi:hypothetical protein